MDGLEDWEIETVMTWVKYEDAEVCCEQKLGAVPSGASTAWGQRCAAILQTRPWVLYAYSDCDDWTEFWDSYWKTSTVAESDRDNNNSVSNEKLTAIVTAARAGVIAQRTAQAAEDAAEEKAAEAKQAAEEKIAEGKQAAKDAADAAADAASGAAEGIAKFFDGGNESDTNGSSLNLSLEDSVDVAFSFSVEQAVIMTLSVALAACAGVIVFLCLSGATTQRILKSWESEVTANMAAFHSAASTAATALDAVFSVVRSPDVQDVVAAAVERVEKDAFGAGQI